MKMGIKTTNEGMGSEDKREWEMGIRINKMIE